MEKEIHLRGFELWASGMKLIDIAETLNTTYKAVESWCTRYGWVKRFEERRALRDKEANERYKKVMDEQVAIARAIYADWAKNYQSLPPEQRVLRFEHVIKAMSLAQSWIQPNTLKVETQQNLIDPLEIVALAEEAKRHANASDASQPSP